ncbi:MAG: kelch repeat-containing protein [Planctomycetota bacterium]
MKIATSLVSLVLLGAPALAQWSTATLSLARRDLAAASAGHIALFAGGSIDADRTPVDVVDLYDARTGAWSTSALSQARSFLSATGVDGKILVAGGADQDDVGVDRVDVYDVETGTWTIDSLSEPRVRPAAATVGRYAVFVGGSDGLFGASSDTVDVYDVTTGSWSVATLPFPVSFAEAAPVGDRVVIVDGNGFRDHLLFDPATGVSTRIPRPTNEAEFIVATVLGAPDRFWIAGGYTTGSFQTPLDPLREYDLASGTWSSVPLSEARGGTGAARTATKLVVAGGLIGSAFGFTSTATVDLFDIVDRTRTTAALSVSRVRPATVEVDGLILIAGGAEEVAASGPPSDAVDIYDDRVGSRYCAPAIPNSTGAPADLRVEGAPGTVALGRVALVATSLPEASAGYFLASQTQDFVPNAGGSQGTLCLGGGIGRYSLTPFFAPFGGRVELTIDLGAIPTPTGPVAVLPGETWNFQAWYRDANPGSTTNFTSAVRVTFQ